MTSDATPARTPPMPVPVGGVLDGKYRVDRVIGAGAMGVVVAATHLELDRQVAVKFLIPDALEQGEAVARFLREVQVVSRLESAHVAQVIDSGNTPDNLPYMAIELLEGRDLAQELRARGELGVTEAIDRLLQALDAIGEAHSRGIVHRDLKPGNLFLAQQGGRTVLKVLDFGVSKIFGEEGLTGASLTKTHTLVGSPLYMAPEQVLAANKVDGRADLWAMGVVLFEALTGSPPFLGDTIGVLLTSVLSAPVPALTSRRPDAPAALDRVIARCLERDIDKRYQTAAELARDLLPFASPEAAAALPRLEVYAQRTPSRASLHVETPRKPSPAGGDEVTLRDLPKPSSRPGAEPPEGSSDLGVSTGNRGLWVALVIVVALVGGAFLARAYAQSLERRPALPVGALTARLPGVG